MKLSQALKLADKEGVWAFTPGTFSAMCGGVERNYLKVMLHRLCERGVLMRAAKGVYVNPDARSIPEDPRIGLVPFLRPREVSYVSLESVLSEHSIISQQPTTLTLMTTGASHVFSIPDWGTIEFIHTKRPITPETGVVYRPGGTVPFATARRAMEDLTAVGRNLGLVDRDTLEEVIAEEEQDEPAPFQP